MKMTEWGCMTGGDRDAFLSIYECNYQALFSYGFTLTANTELTKDCIQELFLEIWKKHGTINKDVKNTRAYLFTWLRRKIFKELARLDGEKCTDELIKNFEQNTLPYEDLLIAFQQSEEKKEKLRAALKKLTKKQIEIIRLKFFDNLSHAEIAAKTSLTQRTVYNLLYEGMRHLRTCMRVLVICIYFF
jgi:RNA polymerase sigma-70 factor (ECF subfamily)